MSHPVLSSPIPGWNGISNGHLSAGITDQCDIFEKPLANGWILRKCIHAQVGSPPRKGCCWDEHELLQPPSKRGLKQTDWEWAERDETRLVWASDGQLCTGARRCRTCRISSPPRLLWHDLRTAQGILLILTHATLL